MRRLGFVSLPFILLAFFPAGAQAGDQTAHSAAMIKAAQQVAMQPAYAKGVGAPVVGGVAAMGKFQLPTDGTVSCSYDAQTSFGEGCAYDSISGLEINEPDAWSCKDVRQPPALRDINSAMAPNQAFIGELGARFTERAAMGCNWNHFTTNSAAPGITNAVQAAEITLAWANEIPNQIERDGAQSWRCDVISWREYYSRVANSLHYTQDAQSEHHASGNLVCTAADVVPLLAYNQRFTFKDHRSCATWLGGTFPAAVGDLPQIRCDETVVAQRVAGEPTTLNDDMLDIIHACSEGMTLACMGLERTVRHHCRLPDSPKTLICAGPPNDHAGVTLPVTYCEGEIFSGGGQDFLSMATGASVGVLNKAASRWAEVCKEPDDPCDAIQCDTWCKRSVASFGTDNSSIRGYCVNAAPDPICALHACECGTATSCGASGAPCCAEGAPCKEAEQECSAATGRCVAKGSETCDPPRALYGGPGGYDCGVTKPGGPIHIDDALEVFVNGVSIFTGGESYCTGSVASIPIPMGARKGDLVKLVLSDPQGHHAGLSSLYMKRGGTWMKVDPGVSMLTPDNQNNGVQYQSTFALPF